MTTPIRFPIPTEVFQDSIPHRPPFVWIDEVLSASNEGGVCAVVLRADAHSFDAHGLRRSSYLEFMAQAFAYVRAAQTASGYFADRPAPKRAFLVSVQDADFRKDLAALRPPAGTRLRVQIGNVREVGPIFVFSASVFREDETAPLVQARLKVFSE